MENLNLIFRKFKKNSFIKYGLPFICLIVGGSFGLNQFTQIRYKFSRNKQITPEEMKKYGIEMKDNKEITLESEYSKIEKLDLDNWENIRGPRPWEEKN